MTIEAQLERIAIALETLAYQVIKNAYHVINNTAPAADPPETPTTRAPRARKAKDATAGGAAAEPPAPTATAGGAAEPAAAGGAAAEPPAPTAPVVDLVMLRSRCGKLASAGHRAAVISLIEQHGYKLLTDAPPSVYPALWAGLDRIEAGGQP